MLKMLCLVVLFLNVIKSGSCSTPAQQASTTQEGGAPLTYIRPTTIAGTVGPTPAHAVNAANAAPAPTSADPSLERSPTSSPAADEPAALPAAETGGAGQPAAAPPATIGPEKIVGC